MDIILAIADGRKTDILRKTREEYNDIMAYLDNANISRKELDGSTRKTIRSFVDHNICSRFDFSESTVIPISFDYSIYERRDQVDIGYPWRI